jgi:broad specificity phosphatase PhoE
MHDRTLLITLLRHGEPAYRLHGRMRARDLPGVAAAYNASGIVGTPPDGTARLARDHAIVCCSDLPRAIESARALVPDGANFYTETLFQESAIPHFDRGRINLPAGVWLALLRLFWLGGFSRNGESFTGMKQRSARAAHRLIQLAAEHRSVLLVGHGLINRFIARELLANGWSGPTRTGTAYWAHSSYRFTLA